MSAKKYTYKDYYDRAISKGFELISTEADFKNASSKMKYICPKHQDKGIQETTLGRLLEGKGCYYCGMEKSIKTRMKQFTDEEVNQIKEMCKTKDLKFIDITRVKKGKDLKICVAFICNKHNDKGVQYVPYANFIRNKKCQYCIHKNMTKTDIDKMLINKPSYIKILSNYNLLNDYVDYYCEKHKNYGHTQIKNIIHNSCCYYCGIEKLSAKSRLTKQEVDKRITAKGDNFIMLGKYQFTTEPISIQCKKCGYIWDVPIKSLRYCPNCEKDKMYKGEQMIFDILIENDIEFVQQKTYEKCKNIRKLSFDFYLPKYNTCIEYNGQQHYMPVDYFGGKVSLQHQQHNDNIKREFCKNNNINLIEIPFTYNTKEKIEEIIMSKL